MSEHIDPETIFSYQNHTNIPWNVPEYQPIPLYEEPPAKFTGIDKYITKKGFYMDNYIKNLKDLPSPTHYPTKTLFDQTENKQKSQKVKINPRLKKGTYLEILERENKKTKSAVGLYNLQKTQKELKQQLRKSLRRRRKIKVSEKRGFYDDIQAKTLEIPGAGNYNPHLEVTHFKNERMVPEKWIEKHNKESKYFLKKHKKDPSPCTYRPASAGTFDRKKIQFKQDRKKRHNSLNKGFGTDAKFEYTRTERKKIKEKRPPPTRYNLSIDWKNRSSKKGWQNILSHRSMSIHH